MLAKLPDVIIANADPPWSARETVAKFCHFSENGGNENILKSNVTCHFEINNVANWLPFLRMSFAKPMAEKSCQVAAPLLAERLAPVFRLPDDLEIGLLRRKEQI